MTRPLACLLVASLPLLVTSCARHGADDRGSPIARLLAPGAGVSSASLADALVGPDRMLFPLAVGNRWDYAVHSRAVVVSPSGTSPPEQADLPWRIAITGTMRTDGRDYFMREEANPDDPGASDAPPAYRVRQDRNGLYDLAPFGAFALDPRAMLARSGLPSARRAGLAAATSPARLLGASPPPAEATILRYPLGIGAHWVQSISPRFVRTVEAHELIEVPAGAFLAWRVRTTSSAFGPRDRVTAWYADAGLVRVRIHTEAPALDENGVLDAKVVFDLDQVLSSLSLVGAGEVATRP